MKARLVALFLLLTPLAFVAVYAADKTAAPALSEEEKSLKAWSQKIDECLKYDNLCSHVANRTGYLSDNSPYHIYNKPKPEIMQVFTALKSYVWKYADQMGVDPRAVVAGILAENSINSDVTNDAKNFLARHSIFGIGENGKIGGAYRSVGWGLIHCDTAYRAEVYVASLQNRKPMEMGALCDFLRSDTHPEGAIYAAAEIAREAQDAYAKAGFNVGHKPEIMATLYNIGWPQRHAAEAKASNRPPRPNWFGVFTERYIPQIEQAIGYNDYLAAKEKTAKPAAAPASAVAQAAPVTSIPAASTAIKEAPKQKYLTSVLKVFDSPGSCVQRTQKQAITPIPQGSAFDIVSTSIDCDGNPWELIQTPSGQTGWVQKSTLSQNYELKAQDAPCVPDFKGSQCIADLKETTKDYDPSFKGTNVQMNFYESGASCKVSRDSTSSSAQLESIDTKDALLLWNRLNNVYNPRGNSYYANPAVAVVLKDHYDDLSNMLTICFRGVSCKGHFSTLKTMLNLPSSKGLSSKDIRELQASFDIKVENEKAMRQRLLRAISPCQTLAHAMKDGNDSADFLDALSKDISTQSITGPLFSICTGFYDFLGERCESLSKAQGMKFHHEHGSATAQKNGKAPCDPDKSSDPVVEKDLSALGSAISAINLGIYSGIPSYGSSTSNLQYLSAAQNDIMNRLLASVSAAQFPQSKGHASPTPSVSVTPSPGSTPTHHPHPTASHSPPPYSPSEVDLPYYLMSLDLKEDTVSCEGKGKQIFYSNPFGYVYAMQQPISHTKADHLKMNKQVLSKFSKSKSKDADLALLFWNTFGTQSYVPSRFLEDKAKQVAAQKAAAQQQAAAAAAAAIASAPAASSAASAAASPASSASSSSGTLGAGGPTGAAPAVSVGSDAPLSREETEAAIKSLIQQEKGDTCAENNQDTVELVNAVLKLPCVEHIYLSNFYLYDFMKEQGVSQVMYRPMKETDTAPRLMFDLKRSEGKCGP